MVVLITLLAESRSAHRAVALMVTDGMFLRALEVRARHREEFSAYSPTFAVGRSRLEAGRFPIIVYTVPVTLFFTVQICGSSESRLREPTGTRLHWQVLGGAPRKMLTFTGTHSFISLVSICSRFVCL